VILVIAAAAAGPLVDRFISIMLTSAALGTAPAPRA